MLQRIERLGCYLIIIVLLPYIITIFLNGPVVTTSAKVDESYIKVEHDGKETEMSIEEYCIGRLAREIPASYEKEAFKSQAVLVRTTVYGQIRESGSSTVLPDEFWTADEMREQWGAGKYNENYEKLKDAWQETEGQVLMYGENPANVPYCRLTNGNTRDGGEVLGSEDYPYLKIRECPLDVESKEQIQTIVLEEMDVEITETDTAGYVLSVRVGEETVNGEEFRKTYGLASSSFTVQNYDGKLRITTRGVGHGLGMSQYTANRMAKDGDTYDEILAYFFDGTELKEVADIVRDSE
ncbi:MAG: SpoIID/LytB domain-containing protein [Eubacteriales bacterium]|nr:SpoIID/LytB domain-containing protein [Eubacteriales bacterium]